MNNKYILNLGLTMAVISIVLFLLNVLLGIGMIVSSLVGLLSIAALIVVPIIFIRKQRAAQGYITFGQVFALSFFGLLIGMVIGMAFQFLYINYIDPGYAEKMVLGSLEMTNSMIGGVSDAQANEILAKQERDMRANFTMAGQLKSLGISIIVAAVVSVILAAIFKRTQPLPPNPEVSAEV